MVTLKLPFGKRLFMIEESLGMPSAVENQPKGLGLDCQVVNSHGLGGPRPSHDVFNDIRALLAHRLEQAQRGEVVQASITEIAAQAFDEASRQQT
jgi:hypothetical protein